MEETETLDQKDQDLIDDEQLKTIVVPEGDELVGRMLDDRFLIEKDLTEGGADKGGMGLVYLAQDMKLMGKKTVVKILRKESLENEDIERKFLHEKEALIRLDHPNIVRILDSGTLNDGNPFMVMEYIPGYSLRKVLREQRQLPFDQCAHFVRQITDALSAAHSEKILHRDIKPENIMLTPQEGSFDRVRLIDFGIAKVQESKLAPETQAPRGIGTILYMAPEQLYGKLNPTPAVDVYSTAIMIFEMLTGQHAFQPVSLVEMFELQKEGLKTMPRSLREEIPVKVEELLVTALSYEEDMRPQNARIFGQDLAAALEENYQSLPLPKTEISTPPLMATEPHVVLDTADPPTVVEESVEIPADTQQPQEVFETAQPLESEVQTNGHTEVHTQDQIDNQDETPNEAEQPAERNYLLILAAYAAGLVAVVAVLGGIAYWVSSDEPSRPAQSSISDSSSVNETRTEIPPAETSDVRVAEPGLPARQFSFHLMVQKMREGKPFEVPFRSSGQEVFETGYKFQMFFEKIPAGYFYLFNEGKNAAGVNNYNILFPTPLRNNGSAQVLENQRIETGNNTFAETRGTEYVWVIWTLNRLDQLESLRETAFANEGKVADTVKAGELAAFIEKNKQNQFAVKKDSEIQSTFLDGTGDVMVHKIELEHR